MFDVTIATHGEMPGGSTDDRQLAEALGAAGARVRMSVWNDPSVEWSQSGRIVIRSTWDYHYEPARWFQWLVARQALPARPGTGNDARERSLVFLAGSLSHAFTKPPFLRGVGDGLGETLHEPTEAERHLAGQALQAAPGAVTYARVDVVPTSDGPRLMELELIEPDLGLRLHPPSIEVLAKAILAVSVRSIC